MSKDLPRKDKPPPKKKRKTDWCSSSKSLLWCVSNAPKGLLSEYRKNKNGKMETIRRRTWVTRCPMCRKRLLPKPIHCVGGELIGWTLPPHKEK